MRTSNLRNIESGIRFFLSKGNQELTMGEKFVLVIVTRLLEELQVVSKLEVCEANGIKKNTTYCLLNSLEKKGILKSVRSNQFYSKSFVSLSDKRVLFVSRLKTEIFR